MLLGHKSFMGTPVKVIQKMGLHHFIWEWKKDAIYNKHLIQSIENGGLKCCDMETQYKSEDVLGKTSRWNQYCKMESTTATLLQSQLWEDKGTTEIGNIINKQSNFSNHIEISHKFNLTCNCLQILQIRYIIPLE